MKSHIIPRSLFEITRGSGNYSVVLQVDQEKFEKQFKQAGLWDNILCESCETLFNPFDAHGAKVIIDTFEAKKIYADPPGQPVAYIGGIADYALFKLFILSVIWRASVSSLEFFERINLGPYEDLIRKMIEDRNPGAAADYPVICIHQTKQMYPSTVLPAYLAKANDGLNYCRLYLPNCMIFMVKMDSRPLPTELLPWVLKPRSPALFRLIPYFGSSEMEYIESAKSRTKKHLGLTPRVIHRFEKPKIL